jgi:hypothetical protein
VPIDGGFTRIVLLVCAAALGMALYGAVIRSRRRARTASARRLKGPVLYVPSALALAVVLGVDGFDGGSPVSLAVACLLGGFVAMAIAGVAFGPPTLR